MVLTLSPYVSLARRAVDFISMDGSLSLSLGVAAATADSAAGTLSWPVALRPWKAGDKLMLRVRAAPPGPAAPTGLTATAGSGRVTLIWDDPSDPSITGYEYQMRWTGVGWKDWAAIPNSGAATTSYAVTGLTNGTEYRFSVRAVNVAGVGERAPNADPWLRLGHAAGSGTDSHAEAQQRVVGVIGLQAVHNHFGAGDWLSLINGSIALLPVNRLGGCRHEHSHCPCRSGGPGLRVSRASAVDSVAHIDRSSRP